MPEQQSFLWNGDAIFSRYGLRVFVSRGWTTSVVAMFCACAVLLKDCSEKDKSMLQKTCMPRARRK
jgi:hypothetical protein